MKDFEYLGSAPEIDKLINKFNITNNVLGCAVGIAFGDQIQYLKGYGLSRNNKNRDRFRYFTPSSIGSISKTLTALAILLLHEKGMLNINDNIRGSKKNSNLKFTIEGEEMEYELKQKLPLHLIEQAILNHLENSKEEFDTDVIKSNPRKNSDGSISLNQEAAFYLPEQRFAATFTRSFYDFLLAEAPPAQNEYTPSEKYYAVIASMLNETWFFNHKRTPEHSLMQKVKSWHKLSGVE